jgi:anti-sigma regulatory factor (Ser/Thr protein kinase)
VEIRALAGRRPVEDRLARPGTMRGARRHLRDPIGGARARPTELDFTIDELGALRRLVAEAAASASLDDERAADLVTAVNELATNSICHGGGRGTLRLWREGRTLTCEVRDRGHLPPAAQRKRECPDADAMNGRGLWLVDRLCDNVQISSSSEGGNAVRVRMHLS